MNLESVHHETEPSHSELPQNPLKTLSLGDWIYLPHIFSRQERALVMFFIGLALIGGITASSAFFYQHTKEAAAIGGTFHEGLIRPPERVNPLFLSDNDTDRDITALVFSRLFTYDGKGALVSDAAENYTISDDGKSYTV